MARFTAAEDLAIRQYAADGVSNEVAAKLMGRLPGSVHGRAAKLGVVFLKGKARERYVVARAAAAVDRPPSEKARLMLAEWKREVPLVLAGEMQ